MSDQRARTAGILYLLTFVTSIPALALKQPYLDAGGLGDPTPALLAVTLEIVLALCCLGTAVMLYPVTRPVSQVLALGFIGSRALESSLVLLGAVALFALISLDGAGGVAAAVLVGVHDSAFLIGPGLLPAVNAVLLGIALYRGRLVPRVLPIIGFIGAPLLTASALATLFGAVDQVSPLAGVAALPIAAWELGLGLWLLVRGTAVTHDGRERQNRSRP